jgi:hypothetical protein
MTVRFTIGLFAFVFILIKPLSSFGQPENDKATKQDGSLPHAQFDTSLIAVIPFNQNSSSVFDKDSKPSTLAEDDFKNLDSLLASCITAYNNSLDELRKHQRIDLTKTRYYKQLIVVINKNGEKEVWLNCLCNTRGGDAWRTKIIMVDDGGNCYFNLRINLTTKKYYNLMVNGLA